MEIKRLSSKEYGIYFNNQLVASADNLVEAVKKANSMSHRLRTEAEAAVQQNPSLAVLVKEYANK